MDGQNETVKTPRTDTWHVLFEQLVFSPEKNNRIKYRGIEQLMNSIVAAGEVIHELSVYRVRGTETFEVRHGNRRYLAVKMGIEKGLIDPKVFRIPVKVVYREKTETERILAQLEENTGGMPNTIMEEAIQYGLLSEQGLKPEEIALKRRVSITHVRNCFLLLTAPEKLRQLIIDDNVAATQVIKMLKNNTPEEVEKMVVEAYEYEKEKKALAKEKKGGDANWDDDDDISRREDNTKYTGASGMELDEDSSEPVKVRITAKSLKSDKKSSNRYHETEVKNLIMSALLQLSDWKEFSINDTTTREQLVGEVDEWFQKNKDAGGEKYF